MHGAVRNVELSTEDLTLFNKNFSYLDYMNGSAECIDLWSCPF